MTSTPTPDTCVYAENDGDHVTIAETIDAVTDDDTVAQTVERELFDRFLDAVFTAVEDVGGARRAGGRTGACRRG